MTPSPTLLARSLWTGWGLPAAILLLLAASLVASVGPTYIDLPGFGATDSVTSPLTSFCAWAVVLAALRSAMEPSPSLFATAPRVTVYVNIARIALVTTIGVLLLTIISGNPTGVWNTTAALLGEGLLSASAYGLTLCWLLPTTHLLISTVMGAANRTDLAAWAWILEPTPDVKQVALSSTLVILGTTAWVIRSQTIAAAADGSPEPQ